MDNGELLALISTYWDIAYREGRTQAKTDTPNGDAQRTWGNIQSEVKSLYAKIALAEALMYEVMAMEIRANVASDSNECLEDHLQNVGRSQAYCKCKQKLREALGEKEAG